MEGRPAQRNIFFAILRGDGFELDNFVLGHVRVYNSTSNHRLWLVNHGFPRDGGWVG